jgi:ABC-type hemin transport system ATPase subunit
VVVLHHLDDAHQVGDRLVLMHRGRILAAGAPDAVLAAQPLAIAFRVAPVPGGAMGFRLLEGG